MSPLCIDNLRLPPSPHHLSPPPPPRQIIPSTATWDEQYIVTQEYVIIPDIDAGYYVNDFLNSYQIKNSQLCPIPFLVVVVYEQSWPLNNQGTTTLCPATQPFTPFSMDCRWVTQDHTFFSRRFSNFQNHLIYIGLGGALDWGKWTKNSPQWKFDTSSERFLTESSGSIISPLKKCQKFNSRVL